MRRFLVIVLLALLPLQFSWAAVAVYCGHEAQAGHFGHHDHQHHAHAAGDADVAADAKANPSGDKAPGSLDPDCGHCHGYCGVILALPAGLPGVLTTAPPSATRDDVFGATAPTRPERPKWLCLA